MMDLGYEGAFKQKSRESMGQYGKVDGCATFWKTDKFQLLEDNSFEFNECASRMVQGLNLDKPTSRKFMHRLSKDNIAQVLILDSLHSRNLLLANMAPGSDNEYVASLNSAKICVVNTHIYSNQNFPDVKLWQTWTLTQEVEQICGAFQNRVVQQQQQYSSLHEDKEKMISQQLSTVVCGDFNSEPTSAVYELMRYGQIETSHAELDAIWQSNAVRVLPDLENLNHNFEWSSVMESIYGSEPLFTNYTANYKGTLDYMFYSHSTMQVVSATHFPDEQSLLDINMGGLPNVRYPSDHLMLSCTLAIAVNLVPSRIGRSSMYSNRMGNSPMVSSQNPASNSALLESLFGSQSSVGHNNQASNSSKSPTKRNNPGNMSNHAVFSNAKAKAHAAKINVHSANSVYHQ